jgi:hypothetical protein
MKPRLKRIMPEQQQQRQAPAALGDGTRNREGQKAVPVKGELTWEVLADPLGARLPRLSGWCTKLK